MKIIIIIVCIILSIGTVFPQALDTDTMLAKIAAEKNDSIRARIVWDCLGTSETDPVLDMRIAEKLLVHSKQTNDSLEAVFALACLGYDYRAFGDNPKSWKYSLQAIAAAEQQSNEEAKASAHLVLALNYEDISDYPKALQLYTSAVEYATRTQFDKVLSICYLSLGEFYLTTNKVDSALIYSQRAYELIVRIGYDDYKGAILQQLGTVHARLGNAKLAIGYFELAVEQGYKINSPKFINESYAALSRYYQDAGHTDSAVIYAKKAIAAVERTAFTNYSLSPAKLLLDVYRTSNIDSAFKYSEIYRIANDSLFNAKSVQQTQLLAFEENVRQRQVTEDKINTEEQRTQNIQYALLAVGILTFLVLFLLLSRSFITSTKLIEFLGVIALLIVFEFLNLLLHPLLEGITHHTPALMLLALVGIAALLVPFHHKAEKWSTNKLVEKNKAIRLAHAKKTIERLEER
jgi:tetratricopeptide (TPR) repeat protein